MQPTYPVFSAPRAPRGGFTLIELLTVIAVIGILAAIIVPVLGRVRVKAASAKSASNLRQLAVALNTHVAETGRVTGSQIFDVQLAPYMGFKRGVNGQFAMATEAFFTHPREESTPRIAGAPRRSYAQNNRYSGATDDRALGESGTVGKRYTRIPTPSRVMIYTERTGPGNPGGCVGQGSFTGIHCTNHDPVTMAGSADWDTAPNGTPGVFNYAFVDGHVETRRFNDPQMIGAGSVTDPAGAWTVRDGD